MGRNKRPPVTRISQRLAARSTQTPTLPPELWSAIFAFIPASGLCAAKLVCQHWRDIVSSTPLRAECKFVDEYHSIPPELRVAVENESMRVGIGENCMSTTELDDYLVPGLSPLISITVRHLRDDWDAFPSDFPLFDTIRQLVLDRCGLNVTLVLAPSFLKPARIPARFDIPLLANNHDVKRMTAAKHDAISPVTREYLSAITKLHISNLENQAQFKNVLALMRNIEYVNVYMDYMDHMDNIDFGLDTLPNLRNLTLSFSTIERNLLDDIAKLRHLERLQLFACVWDDVDLDALCDMFSAMPRLWFLMCDSKSMTMINMLQLSDQLRRTMGSITHFVVRDVTASASITVIKNVSRLENIKRITVYLKNHSYADMRAADIPYVTAAKAKARELRSARLRIDIIE